MYTYDASVHVNANHSNMLIISETKQANDQLATSSAYVVCSNVCVLFVNQVLILFWKKSVCCLLHFTHEHAWKKGCEVMSNSKVWTATLSSFGSWLCFFCQTI